MMPPTSTPPALRWLLGSYGIGLTAGGIALIAAPDWANRMEAGVTGTFVEHLAQSRGAAVLALGVIALAALRRPERHRRLLPGLAWSAALLGGLFLMVQLSPQTTPCRWIAVLFCSLWAAGLAWQAGRSMGEQDAPMSPPRLTEPGHMLILSFALWTGITGLLWLVAPGPLGSKLEALAGPGAGYFAAARGAVDLPLGWIAWTVRDRVLSAAARPAIIGIFVANIILSIAGLIAQLESIATPSRWLIELLHIGWMAGAGALLWQGSKSDNS
ncbi:MULTISPECIES: hypothetical protein [unclassified Sphingomonas]|uniref:hypothetical protein n=1 Tax=unclassified Sphingomonas TaxID=196159 RepID=UPI0006F1ECE6|nr:MULTISPECIES: hypothetical protein [unclassified Sphingomonas]KRB89322.1 hypothetical protein ASE22_16690 [Sphingomonas sp. Root720]